MMDPVGSINLGGIHFELGRGFEGQLLSKEMSHEFRLFQKLTSVPRIRNQQTNHEDFPHFPRRMIYLRPPGD